MKICFLAAGDSVHSYRWIGYFAERGHDIHWISLVPKQFPDLPNTTFHDLSARASRAVMPRALLSIRSLVRRIAPDIVHAHYAGSYGLLGMASAVQPFVLTAWGSDILFASKAPVRGAIIRRVLSRARLITCDADHMVEAIRHLGADEAKIKVVYFGIDTAKFEPGPASDAIRAGWQAGGRHTGDHPLVISLRSLEPVYDISTLLRATSLLVQKLPSVRIVICGGGSLQETLQAEARDLGLEGTVLFTGRYDNTVLADMLRSADVYVSTSLSDGGIAASTAEAMACGVPVVVSNSGENDKWVDHGVSGWLFETGNADALAQSLFGVLSLPAEQRQARGLAGRVVIAERNDYRREMEKMERLYQSLRT